MITEFGQGKYYLYRHIRLDTGKPFYIGIGTKSSKNIGREQSIYVRAYSKTGRNKIWKGIVKRSVYEVEILLESDDYDFVQKKEVEFVSIYGRIDLKTGTLSNLNIGGNGGHIYQSTHKTKKGQRLSEEKKRKLSENHFKNKKVYQYDLDGNFIREFNSALQAGYFVFNRKCGYIGHIARGTNSYQYSGYFWSYQKHTTFKPEPKIKKSSKEKQLITFKLTHPKLETTDKITNKSIIWNSLIEFFEQNPDFNKDGVYRCLHGGRKFYKGYSYRYISKEIEHGRFTS